MSKNPTPQLLEARLRAVILEQETRMNEMADMVANVRHGINNPLAGVLGQVQLLLRADLPQEVRAGLESVERLALRVRDTAAELRHIQRPQPACELLSWLEDSAPPNA
jgi:signal transduction histidine kinase